MFKYFHKIKIESLDNTTGGAAAAVAKNKNAVFWSPFTNMYKLKSQHA